MAEVKPRIKPKLEPMEIATIQRDIHRWTYGGVLENLDDTLRTRGRGKGLKIYDEIERDAHAYAVLQKRKLAVVARPWQVDAASDDAIDQEAAELVRRQLQGLGKARDTEQQLITGFDQATANFLDATLKGFAVGEVMWEARGAEIVAARIIPRDQRRFVFDEELRLRLLTRESITQGEALPERKFVVHSFGAKDGSPYGLGLGHRLFWPVYFKRQDIGFWLVFADKFGSPTAVGKYPGGAGKTERDKLLEALKAIANESQIVIPDGMLVELLEAKRAGSIDTYEKLARYMDEQISVCVLGETITTSPKATGLGSGVAERQNEVRLEIAKADADMLSDTLNATLVRWIVEYNLPDARPPIVYRSFDEPEDLERRSKVDQALHEMGYEPEDLSYLNETYGGRWRRRAARPAAPNDRSARPERGAEFAEGERTREIANQEEIAAAADDLARDWQRLLGPRVAELIAFAESSGDLATLRERLAELAAGAPRAELVRSLERAGFAAQLLGRTPAEG
jgi:phage gp29-like protein